MTLFRLHIFLRVLIAAALVVAVASPARAATTLTGVRIGVHSPTETRVVVDLDGEASYALSGDAEGAGRIVVDLAGVNVGSELRARQAGGGQVAAFEIRAVAAGKERITLSLGATAAIKAHFVIPAATPGAKTRLVIDLVASDRAGLLASLPSPYQDLAPVIQAATQPTRAIPPQSQPVQAAPALTTKPPLVGPVTAPTTPAAPAASASTAPPWGEKPSAPAASAASQLITVVIDAGHGGGDPGATGAAGALEKTVTLAAANELATQLRAKGRYNVVLTRQTDRRLHLDERSRLAREAGAQLFISLHADAHADPAVRGGSVYTLSEKGAVRAANEVRAQSDYEIYGERIAERPGDVSSTLIDLAQRHTRNESARFASMLLANIRGVTPLLKTANRREDLYVLLSPDVPAVLFELAFISNAADEKNLTSPAWRKRVMRAVAASIDAYFTPEVRTGRAVSAADARPAP